MTSNDLNSNLQNLVRTYTDVNISIPLNTVQLLNKWNTPSDEPYNTILYDRAFVRALLNAVFTQRELLTAGIDEKELILFEVHFRNSTLFLSNLVSYA